MLLYLFLSHNKQKPIPTIDKKFVGNKEALQEHGPVVARVMFMLANDMLINALRHALSAFVLYVLKWMLQIVKVIGTMGIIELFILFFIFT